MDKLHETGNVTLKWLGQMGFLIETGHERLCIDYYASPDIECIIPKIMEKIIIYPMHCL